MESRQKQTGAIPQPITPAVSSSQKPARYGPLAGKETYAFINWDFFGLKEAPFSLSPDPRYYYLGYQQELVVSQLLFGIGQRKGFMLVTGEVGTGKTLLCRTLLEQLDAGVHGAMILGSGLKGGELIHLITRDFGITGDEAGSGTDLERLNRFLLERFQEKKNSVLVIDEAQNLTADQLEQVRTISNLETDREKILQIILVGQPELRAKLREHNLRQLNQRIAVRTRLGSFSWAATKEYLRHRLAVAAAGTPPPLFTAAAMRALHFWGRGTPRLLNLLGDRALMKAYSAGVKKVNPGMVREARKDLEIDSRLRPLPYLAAGVAAAAALALFFAGPAGRKTPGEMTAAVQPVPLPAQTSAAINPARKPAAASTLKKDENGIYRVDEPGRSLQASLATLFDLWNMGYLAGESLSWKIVNFNTSLLDVFFREMGIFEQYGVELHPRKADLDSIRSVGLPLLFGYRAGQEEGIRYAVLGGLSGGAMVVYDPLEGRREVDPRDWQEQLAGPVFYLYKGQRGLKPLFPGNSGPEVVLFQEQLRKAGLYKGPADGRYGPSTGQAVRTLQKGYGIQEDGAAGLETQLVLMRATRRFVPLLEGE